MAAFGPQLAVYLIRFSDAGNLLYGAADTTESFGTVKPKSELAAPSILICGDADAGVHVIFDGICELSLSSTCILGEYPAVGRDPISKLGLRDPSEAD
jgi:hypothetical protein